MTTKEEYMAFRLAFHNCATVLDAVEKLEAEQLNQADRMKSLERERLSIDQRILELQCEQNRTHLDLQFFRPLLEKEEADARESLPESP